MTRFLDQVLAEVRKLSDDEQDRIAAELMAHLETEGDDRDLQLSDEQLAEVRRRRIDPNPRNVTIEEIDARLRRSPE
jgi:hypothetical protein